MYKPLALAALIFCVPAATVAQRSSSPTPEMARLENPVAVSGTLPDAPSTALDLASAPNSTSADAPASAVDFGQAQAQTAPRFAFIIRPGEQEVPLHGMEKLVYGLHDSFNPLQMLSITVSAGWSHVIDSQPHYGTNAEAFGKREGAAALRSTIQTMATDAVFSPMFHDDPRYFMAGDGHPFLHRVVYAASRVVLVRSSYTMRNRLNVPLLLGYGVAAGANNLYYPDQDRNAKQTFEGWGTSLAGAALGFEVDEFLDDALRMVHLKKK